jgi:hypothetical protein
MQRSAYRLAGAAALWVSATLMAAVPTRTPWTTSRIEGTPEPPLPFVSEQLRPELEMAEALELAAIPGTDRFLVVERRGKVSSFSLHGTAATPDLIVDLLSLHPKLDNAFGVVLHPNLPRRGRSSSVMRSRMASLRAQRCHASS